MGALRFIIIAAVCISIFYLAYLAFLKKETNFRNLRFYLLGSIMLSLLIPLNTYRINTGITLMRERSKEVTVLNTEFAVNTVSDDLTIEKNRKLQVWWNEFTSILHRGNIIVMIYLAIVGALLLRIALQIAILFIWIIRSEKVRQNNCTLLYNRRFKNTFSFFRWIFICEGCEANGDMKQIITHEKTHANQYHSLDLLLMELLTAVLWFNPLVWMMKNSMLLVHEYLADEGALKSGVDPLRYRVLLLNQVAEGKFICLSSSFSSARLPGQYSLIKKRMIMMTNKKISSRTKSGFLALIPISALLLLVTSTVNGSLVKEVKEVNSNIEATIIKETSEKSAKDVMPPSDTTKKKQVLKVVVKNNSADTITIESDIAEPDNDMTGIKVTGYGKQKDSGNIFIRQAIRNETSISEGDTLIVVSNEKPDQGKSQTSNMFVNVRKDGKSPNILFIVDEVKTTDISMLHPEDIESMSVLKGELAKNYSSENYDGVIIVKTKKKN